MYLAVAIIKVLKSVPAITILLPPMGIKSVIIVGIK
jgi:hypothetical protein